MRRLLFIFLIINLAGDLAAQNSADTVNQEQLKANADDPSQFFTRVEVYNELQRYDKSDSYLNQTVVRTIVKIGKRFTTRLDLPLVYNSAKTAANTQQFGLGDISFRLLGYRFFEKQLSAFTASMEVSLNTAESPLLGSGKNILIPMVTYSKLFPKQKMILASTLQQAISVSGDESRNDLSFTKIQVIGLRYWSRRTWIVLAPEWYIDYIHGGVSMNLRTRLAYAPIPRMNIWITPSAGIFGDFVGRYTWSLDIGGRYFLFRGMDFKKK